MTVNYAFKFISLPVPKHTIFMSKEQSIQISDSDFEFGLHCIIEGQTFKLKNNFNIVQQQDKQRKA